MGFCRCDGNLYAAKWVLVRPTLCLVSIRHLPCLSIDSEAGAFLWRLIIFVLSALGRAARHRLTFYPCLPARTEFLRTQLMLTIMPLCGDLVVWDSSALILSP